MPTRKRKTIELAATATTQKICDDGENVCEVLQADRVLTYASLKNVYQ
jgi:hypothetical protein